MIKIKLYLPGLLLFCLVPTLSLCTQPFATQIILTIIDDSEPSNTDVVLKPSIETITSCLDSKEDLKGNTKLVTDIAYTIYYSLNTKSLTTSLAETAEKYFLKNKKIQESILECKYVLQNNRQETPAKSGAMINTLLAALLEEECIVIVSSSVVNYLMRFLQELYSHRDYLLNNYNAIHYFQSSLLKLMMKKGEQPEDWVAKNWIKKKVTDYLYILVPKDYIGSRKNFKALNKIENIIDVTGHSAAELTIGIKLKGKKTFSDTDFVNPSSHPNKNNYKNILSVSDHFIEKLNDIFIKQQRYKKKFSKKNEEELMQLLPQSVIITDGHGSAPDSHYSFMAGLRLDDFAKFITFAEKNIITKLFFFNTCYASETNLKKVIEFTAQEMQQKLESISFSFPIISGAISATSAIGAFSFSDSKIFHPLFKNFLDTFNKSYPSEQQIFDALQYVYIMDPKKNNVPLIKYKDLPWRVIGIPNLIVSIDETITKTHDKNKPLDISTFFKGTQKGVQVYPNIITIKALNIPFQINLTKGKYSSA